MDIRLLGVMEAEHAGRLLSLGGLRQRAVLALLALHANEVVSVDRLVDELWSGEPPASVTTTLRGYLSHLRSALADTGAVIETRKPGYALVVDPDCIDRSRFSRGVSEGLTMLDRGDLVGGSARLRRALGEWRGQPLEDFSYESWATPYVARLTEQRLVAEAKRVDADLALGRTAQLVPELEALVDEHPLREAFRGQLMRALAATGRRADALRVYQQGRKVLVQELGLDPSPELQRLEEAILLQDDSLTLPADPEADAPPPPPPGNLRAPATTFVGRVEEQAEVAALLAEKRLVTLTGAGGSGKTRLSIEVARSAGAAADHPDGIWMIELAALNDPTLVARAVAVTLGIPEQSDRPLQDTLAEALAARRCLLVLDNCEHLVEAVAELAAALLAACPGLRLLATSRHPLGLPEEQVWEIPTLGVPTPSESRSVAAYSHDAMRLFADRAATVVSGFEPSTANVEIAAHVCRRLDGIPLAIELATARLATMPLPLLAARLDDKFEVLAAGSPGVLPRHWTLRAAIEWSFDLLDESERRAFSLLGAFAGPFTADLAAGMGVSADELHALTAKSMVARMPGEPHRYRLLEAIRDYAGERLAKGDGDAPVEAIRDRHASLFNEWAERAEPQLYGRGCADAFARFELHHDDFRAALSWSIKSGQADLGLALATALWQFWNMHYHVREGREWLERLLSLSGAQPAATLGALRALADLTYWDEDIDAALVAGERALALAEQVDNGRLRVRAEITMAEILREADRSEEALALATKGGARAGELADPVAEADAARVLAMLAGDRGDVNEVERQSERALRLADRAGYIDRAASALAMLGGVALARGDLDGAAALFEECLQRFREVGDTWSVARATNRSATIATARGEGGRGYELAREALSLYEALGSREGASESLLVMSDAALADGEVEQAALLGDAALNRSREGAWRGFVAWSLQSTGAALLHQNDVAGAAPLLEEAVERYRAGDARDGVRGLRLLGVTRTRQGRVEEAQELLDESLRVANDNGDRRAAALSLVGLAEAAAAAGEAEAGARYLSAARFTLDAIDAALPLLDERDAERVRSTLIDQLGDSEFARAWDEERRSSTVVDLRVGAALSREPAREGAGR